MAEATLVERPPVFFCHECNVEVQPNIPAFTCSRCNSGFIEEMEEPALPAQPTTGSHDQDSIIDFAEVSRIINYVVQQVGNNLGRTPLILRGNPADYAWGPNGLDAIISQLLNHLEGTGAPPAQKDKIENLPRVIIEQSHVDNTQQCSICMDDFELAMEVRKLPCDHLYHSECIIKWLEMHGTCPVCRKDLNGEDTSANEAEFSPSFHSGADGASTPTSSSSSSTTSMESTPSSSFSDLCRN
ncbi:unnamed protein product [Candidula unifasciata]|uniref:RING-type E3 ubiquitin transferase n=1 Tax=Candidula unifasciata TaxID=100452 RepID=A0A8S3YI68_9EUPU|nr:unnamed protein product [Candidula unifasciata]